jgi:hypothetical protein
VVHVSFVDVTTHSEVGNLDSSVGTYQNISCCQVPVHHAVVCQILLATQEQICARTGYRFLTILTENRIYNCHHIIINIFYVDDSVRLGYDARSHGNQTSRRLSMKALTCFETSGTHYTYPEGTESSITTLYGPHNVLRCAD